MSGYKKISLLALAGVAQFVRVSSCALKGLQFDPSQGKSGVYMGGNQ